VAIGSITSVHRTVHHLQPYYLDEITFTADGSWTFPEDQYPIYELAAVAVGGGGGGYSTDRGGGGGYGGDLRWANRIDADPGDVLTITVGAGGSNGSKPTDATPGSGSKVAIGETTIIYAAGGPEGSDDADGANSLPSPKIPNPTSTTVNLPFIGGGAGGRGGWEELSAQAGGGGGAGGYSGPGGSGGHADEAEIWGDLN
jgi:hypothetical protein